MKTPSRLYKFYSLPADGPERAYRKRIFTHRDVYFARSSEFNDPYDMYPNLSMECTRAEYKEHLRQALDRHHGHLSDVEKRRSMRASLRKNWPFSKRSKAKRVESYRRFLREDVGVLSLTTRPDSLLMWGHYAQKHTGFCVEFSPAGTALKSVRRVRYFREPPVVNLITDFLSVPRLVAQAKAWDWRYEKEWRSVASFHPPSGCRSA